MLKNFIVTAFRKFLRNRYHSSINIIGLTLGLTCSFLIFSIIQFELSFDKHHDESENIYRVLTSSTEYGNTYYRSGIPYRWASTFPEDFNQVPYASIVNFNFGNPLIYIQSDDGQKVFEEPGLVYVEPDYFSIFKYNWISGSDESPLSDPNSMIIARSVALKYFGTTDVVGKSLNMNKSQDLTISAVVEDPPLNSDMIFNIFLSYDLLRESTEKNSWTSVSDAVQYFIKVKDQEQYQTVNAQLTEAFNSHWDKTDDTDIQKELWLEPLKDMHFNTEFGWNFGRAISESTIWGLALIGLFLIITASINFINLNTALASTRILEVGVRKVMGSSRGQLSVSYLLETAIITLVSLLISLGLTELGLLYIEPLLGYEIMHDWLNPQLIAFIFILFISTVLLSGFYPSYMISKYNPIEAMKYKFISRDRSMGSRKILIIFQFFISQALIICTLVVGSQLYYFRNQEMGFNKEEILEFYMPSGMDKHEVFKNEVNNLSGVVNVSYSNTGAASTNLWWGGFKYEGPNGLIEERSDVKFADENFIETYDLTLIAGNDVTPSDSVRGLVVNEAFTKTVGSFNVDEVLGNTLTIHGQTAPITGVIEDYVASSMKREVKPLIIIYKTQNFMTCAVRYKPGSFDDVKAGIEGVYKDIYPDNLLEVTKVEDKIDQFYTTESRLARLFYLFSIVAIVIGSIGLLGLISFMVSKKRKEVGIRKVMGASVFQVISLFAKEFGFLISIGFIIASVLSYYFMDQWLADFPYRISLSWFYFAGGIFLTGLIAFGTIGIQSYQAATMNPATILRDE